MKLTIDASDLHEVVSELAGYLETKAMPDHLRARIGALIDTGPLTRFEDGRMVASEELLAVLASARALP